MRAISESDTKPKSWRCGPNGESDSVTCTVASPEIDSHKHTPTTSESSRLVQLPHSDGAQFLSFPIITDESPSWNIERGFAERFGWRKLPEFFFCISREGSLKNENYSVAQLSSPRSSSEMKTRALEMLEQLLAFACVSKDSSEDLHNFTALQYTFECNGVCISPLIWYPDAMFFQYL